MQIGFSPGRVTVRKSYRNSTFHLTFSPKKPVESSAPPSTKAMNTQDQPEIGLNEIHSDNEDFSQSSERERASLLARVMKDQAERSDAFASAGPRGPKPLGPQLLALALATVAAAYFWFGSPGWLNRPPPPMPTMAEEGSAVELVVWLGIQQVEDFRGASGRIPGPQELGPLPPGLEYRRLDAHSYLIAGKGDRVRVTYSSGESQDHLREAVQRILEGAETQ